MNDKKTQRVGFLEHPWRALWPQKQHKLALRRGAPILNHSSYLETLLELGTTSQVCGDVLIFLCCRSAAMNGARSTRLHTHSTIASARGG